MIAAGAIVRARREICRACPRRTSNPAPRLKRSRGLTSASICLEAGLSIAEQTLDEAAACPLGKWHGSGPKSQREPFVTVSDIEAALSREIALATGLKPCPGCGG